MWRRFSENGRRVVALAQEEAGARGEAYVYTEHLLLAILRLEDSVGALVLLDMNVTTDAVRRQMDKDTMPRRRSEQQEVALSPKAKHAIDFAHDEATALDDGYVGSEHVLLGLIREQNGLAARVLTRLGVELEPARERVVALKKSDRSRVP